MQASLLGKDGKEARFRNNTNGVVHNCCRRVRQKWLNKEVPKRHSSDQPSTTHTWCLVQWHSILKQSVAVDAMYHEDCYKRFLLASVPLKRRSGRPKDEGISNAMEKILDYIEGNDKCQFRWTSCWNRLQKNHHTWRPIRIVEKI